MEEYTVVKYSSLYCKAWNDFLLNSKNATFLFHRDFMEYHADRFEDFSLMIFKKGKLIALFPANKSGDKIYSHQGLSYGGVLLKDETKLREVLNIFYTLLEFLDKKHFKVLEVKMLPSFYTLLPNQELNYLLFVLNAHLVKSETLSVINQKNPVPISKNRLEGCKRGLKTGLKVIEETDFKSFWNEILIPNLIKKHQVTPVHTLEEISYLKQKFPENIKQFNVYQNRKIVAGATMFLTENVAHCQYISGNADKNQLGSLDFLFQHLIKNVFVEKAYFDFGSSNENDGKNINTGLQFWKEGFGARTMVQEFYSINIGNYHALKSVML
ncbi:GNAT family N-acetyltransferase [Tamlana crocina]|uniref:GNAT family N-acetyltransferase n=1 Tax=Tamlana crocina TaxID=393006 RepID=A0ABX1D8M4_9FLAO|nr:GNAT family N-acetyltransferase [Tamlana crocina]NJX14694.1 GNAT family N-acetyltransferase [Tamlana crocina]